MKNQNLNKGDKLLCKKNYNNSYMRFTKGIEYYVSAIEINSNDYKYYFCDDDDLVISCVDEICFFDFFYIKNGIRKIKLEKLKTVYE